MFDIVESTLSAAVASAGTFTVSYPANRSAGDYTGAHNHKMQALGANFAAPNDFSVSFDASEITITYNASTTLPAGTDIILQFDRFGTNRPPVVLPASMRESKVHVIDLGSPDADDANGYVESQDLTSAGVFSVDTTATAALAAAALKGKPDVPRNVVAAWTTTAVLTITGKDVDGNTMVEKSASGTSHTGKKAFAEVTDISSSANITGLTVGTGDVLGLPVYIPDASYVIAELEDGVAKARDPQTVRVPFYLADVSTAGQIYVPCPVAGTVKRIVTALNGAITGADAGLTAKINGTAITGGTLTIANSGSAAGDIDTASPSAANTVAVDDKLEIETDGASTNAVAVSGWFEIECSPAQQLDGTLVAGVTTKATATTGDVRGTYDPSTDADGSTAYALVAVLPDPADDGVPQYTG